jgi:hypothetical protein
LGVVRCQRGTTQLTAGGQRHDGEGTEEVQDKSPSTCATHPLRPPSLLRPILI